MAKLTLSYFPIRARAEFMRLFLADAAVEFEDKRIPYDEEWKNNLKAQYPFVQLPVLDVQDEHGNNFRLPETNAILQYLEETYTVIPGYRELSPLERASIIAVRDVCSRITLQLGTSLTCVTRLPWQCWTLEASGTSTGERCART